MRFTKVREAARQAAEQEQAQPTRRKKRTLASHPLFVPVLTMWGCVLGAGAIYALPPATSLLIANRLGFGVLNQFTTHGLIAASALVCGAAAYLIGSAMRRRTGKRSGNAKSLVTAATGGFEPIDPAAELGSESLDAPIAEPALVEDAPAIDALDENEDPQPAQDADEFTQVSQADRESAAIEFAPTGTDEPAWPQSAVHIELDLAEFAAMPGRNAVWVQEPDCAESAEDTAENEPSDEPHALYGDCEALEEIEPAFEREPVAPTANVDPATGTPFTRAGAMKNSSALERLRRVPPQELSLVELVERFAAALHAHQDRQVALSKARRSPQRDAALAEALKALTALSGKGPAGLMEEGDSSPELDELRGTTRELRDALSKLQDLSGAA